MKGVGRGNLLKEISITVQGKEEMEKKRGRKVDIPNYASQNGMVSSYVKETFVLFSAVFFSNSP